MEKFRNVEFDAEVGPLTTFGIEARAAALARWRTADDLAAIVADGSLPRPLKAIGGGSNLLFVNPFSGTLLLREGAAEIVREDELTLLADCNVVLDDLCGYAVGAGLRGLENLSGIPGTLGGAIVQNAGAYGAETADALESVELFDLTEGRIVEKSRRELDFGYRTSALKQAGGRYVALRARLRLQPADAAPKLDYGNLRALLEGREPTPQAVREAVLDVRRSKLPDPAEVGSAGSFFRNPEVSAELLQADMPRFELPDGLYKVPAAWLIDRCGLKGASVGGASTWPGQPLVIVNTCGQATAADVVALEKRITDTVAGRYGIILTPEVEHL